MQDDGNGYRTQPSKDGVSGVRSGPSEEAEKIVAHNRRVPYRTPRFVTSLVPKLHARVHRRSLSLSLYCLVNLCCWWWVGVAGAALHLEVITLRPMLLRNRPLFYAVTLLYLNVGRSERGTTAVAPPISLRRCRCEGGCRSGSAPAVATRNFSIRNAGCLFPYGA